MRPPPDAVKSARSVLNVLGQHVCSSVNFARDCLRQPHLHLLVITTLLVFECRLNPSRANIIVTAQYCNG